MIDYNYKRSSNHLEQTKNAHSTAYAAWSVILLIAYSCEHDTPLNSLTLQPAAQQHVECLQKYASLTKNDKNKSSAININKFISLYSMWDKRYDDGSWP